MTAHAEPLLKAEPADTRGGWRQLLTPAASGAWNMALDDVLLARARSTGETVLRIYTWLTPTLSLGRNQTANGRYDLDRLRERGIDVVRRPTGGRAVLHHREITYSVTAPIPRDDLQDSYAAINTLLVAALRALGVDVDVVAPIGRAPLPDNSPCFEVPTSGELTVNGRKLVGSAQFREDGALLQHGSILIDDDQPLLADLAIVPQPPAPPAATLRDALGRAPSPESFLSMLVTALHDLEGADATILTLDQSLMDAVQEREQHYLSPSWTWKR